MISTPWLKRSEYGAYWWEESESSEDMAVCANIIDKLFDVPAGASAIRLHISKRRIAQSEKMRQGRTWIESLDRKLKAGPVAATLEWMRANGVVKDRIYYVQVEWR